jgi:hypothetical protein
MKQNILYVGLDIDDTQYHGSGHCQSKIACAGRARFVVSADA